MSRSKLTREEAAIIAGWVARRIIPLEARLRDFDNALKAGETSYLRKQRDYFAGALAYLRGQYDGLKRLIESRESEK